MAPELLQLLHPRLLPNICSQGGFRAVGEHGEEKGQELSANSLALRTHSPAHVVRLRQSTITSPSHFLHEAKWPMRAFRMSGVFGLVLNGKLHQQHE